MKVFYNPKFKKWQAEEHTEEYEIAAWGDTYEEAINSFNEIKKQRNNYSDTLIEE